MTHCTHRSDHPAEPVIATIEQACQDRGLRLTPLRREVLQLIIEATGPVKAYDLLDSLKSSHQSAAPPTVYRALDFLLENHFIHRLETLNAYVSCFHPESSHSGQFLICERCERVTEIHAKEMTADILAAAEAQGFSPSKQVIEVYGVCGECKSA
ncbi:MAG: transcriptional repressor [Wenzhouxiangellaceae bacterium]